MRKVILLLATGLAAICSCSGKGPASHPAASRRAPATAASTAPAEAIRMTPAQAGAQVQSALAGPNSHAVTWDQAGPIPLTAPRKIELARLIAAAWPNVAVAGPTTAATTEESAPWPAPRAVVNVYPPAPPRPDGVYEPAWAPTVQILVLAGQDAGASTVVFRFLEGDEFEISSPAGADLAVYLGQLAGFRPATQPASD